MNDQQLYEKWLKTKNENYDLKAEIERLRDAGLEAQANEERAVEAAERRRKALEWIRDNAHMGSRDIRQRAEAALTDEPGKWHPEKGKIYEAF